MTNDNNMEPDEQYEDYDEAVDKRVESIMSGAKELIGAYNEANGEDEGHSAKRARSQYAEKSNKEEHETKIKTVPLIKLTRVEPELALPGSYLDHLQKQSGYSPTGAGYCPSRMAKKPNKEEHETKSGTAPGIEMTGVEPELTRLCAAVSGQLYKVKTKTEFELNADGLKPDPEVILLDTDFDVTTAPMAAVAVGNKLVIGFRGSSTLMDWILDFAFAPLANRTWMDKAPKVRAQAGYSALVENYLAKHEKTILDQLETISKDGEAELIFTGHSLAGGLAQVFHLFIEGQLQTEDSKWSKLKTNLTVRTIAFSAPMTTLNLDDRNMKKDKDGKSTEFVEKVAKTMSNIIYKHDPVPHAYGDTAFLIDLVRAALPEIGTQLKLPWFINNAFIKWITRINHTIEERFKTTLEDQKELLKVMVRYRHIGNVIYYEDTQSDPVLYKDREINYTSKDKSEKLFRDINFEDTKKKNIEIAGSNHNFLVKGPGLAYGNV